MPPLELPLLLLERITLPLERQPSRVHLLRLLLLPRVRVRELLLLLGHCQLGSALVLTRVGLLRTNALGRSSRGE